MTYLSPRERAGSIEVIHEAQILFLFEDHVIVDALHAHQRSKLSESSIDPIHCLISSTAKRKKGKKQEKKKKRQIHGKAAEAEVGVWLKKLFS